MMDSIVGLKLRAPRKLQDCVANKQVSKAEYYLMSVYSVENKIVKDCTLLLDRRVNLEVWEKVNVSDFYGCLDAGWTMPSRIHKLTGISNLATATPNCLSGYIFVIFFLYLWVYGPALNHCSLRVIATLNCIIIIVVRSARKVADFKSRSASTPRTV